MRKRKSSKQGNFILTFTMVKKGRKKKKGGKLHKINIEYDNTQPEKYSMKQLEALLDLIPAGLDKLKEEINSRENELTLYENDTDKLKVSEHIIKLYRDQSDLLLNFAHISLDVGRKHREKNEKEFADKVKTMELKLRSELESKFANLKVKLQESAKKEND